MGARARRAAVVPCVVRACHPPPAARHRERTAHRVGLVVARVVHLHRRLVDVRLQRIVGVRLRAKGEGGRAAARRGEARRGEAAGGVSRRRTRRERRETGTRKAKVKGEARRGRTPAATRRGGEGTSASRRRRARRFDCWRWRRRWRERSGDCAGPGQAPRDRAQAEGEPRANKHAEEILRACPWAGHAYAPGRAARRGPRPSWSAGRRERKSVDCV
jgi:hypothetical protein